MKQMDRTKHFTQQPTSPLPSINTTLTSRRLPTWVLLPLRLFLGVTFVYAGIQKLTDPQFFKPTAPGYIGKQIMAFAHGSPIHDVLIHLALPHAALFGLLIALGEIAIGLGALCGLLLRPAAFFGTLLSLVFFLSASWHVYPYFYGADIVFIFCWITMFLAGPAGSGLPALDCYLARYLLEKSLPERREQRASALNLFLGTSAHVVPESVATGNTTQGRQAVHGNRQTASRGRKTVAQRSQQSRRSFILGLVTGVAGVAGLTLLWRVVTGMGGADEATGSGTNPASVATATPAADGQLPPGTATPGSAQGTGAAIAQVSQVPVNSAVTFTIPSNGDPGVVVHLSNNQFVAFDATCTHAGCPVQYDPSSQHLLCPCHGAEFDPAHAAAVIGGPTNTPLTSVPIHVDTTTGAITLSS